MKFFYQLRVLFGLLALFALPPMAASAAPFAPGNIVIARVGDGTAPLGTAAAAVFLDEYTPAGVLVQSVALPTAVSGTNRSLTVSGNSTSELALARTANGRGLVLAGFGAAPGYAAVTASSAADVVRVVGLVGADGSVDTSTSLGDAFSGSSVRSVASADGTSFYVVGTSSTSAFPAGVEYLTLGGFNPTQLNTAPTNIRVVNIAGGNLYVSSGATSYIGLSSVGTGLPTTAGQAVTLLPGFPGTAGPSPYGFFFADLSATVPGVDVVYVADDRGSTNGGGIQKWSLVSGTWVLNGTIASPAGAAVRGLDGSTSGTTVSLIATSPTGLYLLADNTGYNVAPTLTTIPTAVATPGTNTVFRGVAFAPTTPAPLIASFTPASGPAGTTVTITGTDLAGATAVTLNGVAITGFTVVNATTITFVVPAGASSGPIAVTTPGGTATSTATFTVTLPVPTITSLSPSTTAAGSTGFTLTVNGTGFLSGSVVNFNGTALTTTFVSATQLTAAVPAAAVATTGSYPVTVANPSANQGGTSAAATFTVTTAVPTITSFTPTTGAASTTVTVTGTNFTGATAVTLNGVAITGFTVVNATTITFVVPAGASSGAIAVTTPGGTATSTATFTVTLPVPTITSLSPNTTAAGSTGFTLTVNGTGFLSGSVVNFNGTALTTTFVSATQLTAAVPAAAVATTGSYPVTVANPSANQGGTSAAATFTVTTPVPTITSFTPTTGAASMTVTVTGTNFTGATAVTLNGVAITGFTVVSATTITFVVPAGASSGPIAVTTPGGTATSTATFTVGITPVITALSPNAQVAGGADLVLTITGTGFTPTSTVSFNNVSYTQTSSTATTVVVTIPASVLAVAGSFPVSVSNGSLTSNVFTFTVSNPSTAGAFENFETGVKASYAAATVPLASGVWNFSNALIGDTFADKFNGLKSARIRTGGFIAMNFDKTNGAGTVIINAALYGTDTGASFLLEQSTDGGTTYTTVPGAPAALTATLTAYTFAVNTGGNVRFRISNTITVTTTSSPRIVIDDISISNFAAVPTITSFTPTTGGPGTVVTLTGTNLTGTTAVRIGSFNVPVFTVVNATTITLTIPNGTGSVNGFITAVTLGGTATSTTVFNVVSATLATQALPGLTVFPNPATDRFTVQLPTSAPATVALRDLAGRLVLAPAPLGANGQVLLPASLASGVYLLEVIQGRTLAVRRIEKR